MLYKFLGILIIIGWLLVVGICNYAIASEFGPFQGKIVNAETKEPIEGVVVLIVWSEVHFFAGSTFYDAQETLTDKNGEFYIPAIWVFNPLIRLKAEADVIIYKSGYGTDSVLGVDFRGLWKAFLKNEWGAPKGTFIWKLEDNKPIIMLKKLSVEERKRYSTPGWGYIPSNKAKLFIQEINKENKFLGLDEVGPVTGR
ncbi:MAG: hypothetical protein WA240_09250 [Nitrospirota bacterium]